MRGRSGYSAWKVRGSVNSDNFILQIKASYNQFTKAEKKVADYVLSLIHIFGMTGIYAFKDTFRRKSESVFFCDGTRFSLYINNYGKWWMQQPS